ncbi:hypothetical protein [Desulfonatronovibrio magnus]|uniref:hypothetical protein n=1 Tax=Desulfonatronovibrio magnus TaxID=698827 RepID=UPI0005EBC08D|nr:hypothetical protein [Desulfonatronovibrio magnus]
MSLKSTIILIICIFFIAGCVGSHRGYEARISQPVASQVPVPAAYPLSTQNKMQAMHHWRLLAEDVACRISEFLDISVFERHHPIYVSPAGTTPFEKAFYDLLITKLVERGAQVSRHSREAMVLSFDLQMVRHSRGRTVRTQSGVYQSLAPGMYVQRQSPETTTLEGLRQAELHVARSQINVDSGIYTHHLPNIEVMVTTSLTRNDNYMIRDSSIYYINDADWSNYKQNVMYQDPSVVNYRLVDQ